MIGSVTQQMQQYLAQLVENLTIRLRTAIIHRQFNALPRVTGDLAELEAQRREECGQRLHTGAPHLIVESVGDCGKAGMILGGLTGNSGHRDTDVANQVVSLFQCLNQIAGLPRDVSGDGGRVIRQAWMVNNGAHDSGSRTEACNP